MLCQNAAGAASFIITAERSRQKGGRVRMHPVPAGLTPSGATAHNSPEVRH